MKNLLTQWELKKKTNPKLGLWQFSVDLIIEPILWLILMACLCHPPSALTNIDNILKVDVCHWAGTLAKPDDILKVAGRTLVSCCGAKLLGVKTIGGDRKRFCATEPSYYRSIVLEEILDIKRETAWDKVLFSFQWSRTATEGSLALFTSGKQISGHLPGSGSIEN